MILKELLKSVDINKVLPIIRDWFYKDESEFTQEPYYREAYNELLNTEVHLVKEGSTPSDLGEIWINGYKKIELDEIRSKYLKFHPNGEGFEDRLIPSASYPDDNVWSVVLGREIVLHTDINVSNEQVAAVCLYELTYFGYSEKEREEYFNRLHDDLPEEVD